MCACPFLNQCGGCRFDRTAANYHEQKLRLLDAIGPHADPIWLDAPRRRADFSFTPDRFGFLAPRSRDIVPITHCDGLMGDINDILPALARLPWGASGSALVTLCDNGLDLTVTSPTPYFTSEFRRAVAALPLIRVTWNGTTVIQTTPPTVTFGGTTVPYHAGAFLQPSHLGADTLRRLVTERAADAQRVADLFCGLGNFTFDLHADGFDIVGTGTTRDLFKNPLRARQLNLYDCVVMDPPRAGADAQARELAASTVPRVIYVSCNPTTFVRDRDILIRGGYCPRDVIPVDQFPGTAHWELVATFDR